STCLPARATSPTAARPANPAPTTITLGASLPATQRLRRLTAPLLPPTAPRTASRPPKVQPPPAREHATTTVPMRRCGHAEAQVRAAPEHAPRRLCRFAYTETPTARIVHIGYMPRRPCRCAKGQEAPTDMEHCGQAGGGRADGAGTRARRFCLPCPECP